MKIYINKEFKCYTDPGNGLTEVETDFFDGKTPGYIEGYQFIPDGQSWTSEDGTVFTGEMIAPWKNWTDLDALQRVYEKDQITQLTTQNDELLDAIASMVEDVYQQDLAEIEEG